MKLSKINLIGFLLFSANAVISSEKPTTPTVIICSEQDAPAIIQEFMRGLSPAQETKLFTMTNTTNIPATTTTTTTTTTEANTQNLSGAIPAERRQEFKTGAKKQRGDWRDKKHYLPKLGISAQQDPSYLQARTEFRKEQQALDLPFFHKKTLYSIAQKELIKQELLEQRAARDRNVEQKSELLALQKQQLAEQEQRIQATRQALASREAQKAGSPQSTPASGRRMLKKQVVR